MKKNFFVVASILTLILTSSLHAQDPIFSSEVSASEAREHFVRVNRWGRYRFEISGVDGASFQVADKLRGAFARSEPYLSDGVGRADIFLEAGEYKVTTEGPEEGASGVVKLTVTEYVVDNTGEYLVPHTETAAELAALSAVARWIYVPRDTLVYIEATGRHLGALAVFRGGDLLVAEVSTGATGNETAFLNRADSLRPLNGLRVAKRLERGKHLVIAYGEGRDHYAVEDAKSPLFIQWMPPSLDPSRQSGITVGESGRSVYAVSGARQNWHINGDMPLTVSYIGINQSGNARRLQGIDLLKTAANNRSYAGTLAIDRSSDTRVITFSGKPGTNIKLTPINTMRTSNGVFTYNFKPQEGGDYQLYTLHTGDPNDNIGASGVLIDMSDTSIAALQADTLSAARPRLRREFNLLTETGLSSFLWVGRSGSYIFEPEKADFDFRVRRFFVREPRDYRAPGRTNKAATITLDEGLYVVDIFPREMGRAAFTIMFIESRGLGPAKAAKPAASVKFAPLRLKNDGNYRFYLNNQAPELSSAHLKKLTTESDTDQVVYLTGEDAERAERAASKIPELTIGKAQYGVYGKNDFKTYMFTINEAGIYKLETTGRLSTKLVLRNRAGAKISEASSNGVGRNSVIAEYFLPGIYSVTAETLGQSAGRMGVVINRGDLTFGGQLEEGIDKRASVKAFGAAVFNVTINEDGRYRFDAFGSSNDIRMRLEDADGWPLFKHGGYMLRELDVRRGAYRLFSLPIAYDSERAVRMRRAGSGVCADSIDFNNDILRAGECYTLIRDEIAGGRNNDDDYTYLGHHALPNTLVMRVRVDTAGLYEIYSQGGSAIRAKFYAKDKSTEAASDARDEQSWNFIFSEPLDTGEYYLDMTIRGHERRVFPATQIFMRRVRDTLTQKIALTSSGDATTVRISLDERQFVIPIEVSSGDVMTLKASSGGRVACVLESYSGNDTLIVGRRQGREVRVDVPVAKGSKYALKIRSLDGRGGSVDLAMSAAESVPLAFRKALGGVSGIVAKKRHFGNEVFFRIDDVDGGPGHYEPVAAENEIAGVTSAADPREMFLREEGSLVAADGNRLWIKVKFKSAGKYNFVLNPVRLIDTREHRAAAPRRFETSDQYRHTRNQVKYPIEARDSIQVVMREGQNRFFGFDTPPRRLGLITFTANAGRPMAGLTTAGDRADFARGGARVHGGQHIEEKICLTAIIPGDTGRIVAWNALSASAPVHGSLTMRNFAVEEAIDTLKTGRMAWRAEKPLAKEYFVDSKTGKTIVAKISPRAGIFHISQNGKRDMYYGGDGGAIHTIELNGGQMFLFGGAENGNAANIELETFASEPSAQNVLTGGVIFTKHFPIDTRERIRTDASGDQGRLFWSGAIHNVDFINRYGQITQNVPEIEIVKDLNGTLLVDFASGWSELKLCPVVCEPTELASCMWGGALPDFTDAPVLREITRMTMTAGVNRYNISLDETIHASITAPTPAAAITVTTGGSCVYTYDNYWDELSIDVPLDKGTHNIGLKPIGGRSLDGVPLTVRFYPITTLAEGKPLDVYLPPGEKRMARFDLERKSRIGIGLQTAAETVEAILLDNSGKRVTEQSRQIFTELDKGTYYVLLSIPKTSDGLDVKVFLFGQKAPPVDPPAERIKQITGGGGVER